MKTSTAVTHKTGDAAFAVYYLNVCKGTAVHERLTSLHRDRLEFRAKASEQQQTRRGFLNVELMVWLNRRHGEISEGLARYHFRPGISGYSAVGGECRSSLVAIPSRKNPQISGGSFPITEGDVAMALVRLYADGDLGKVRLCETCHNQWRVAAHSNYRFCSPECREQFYKSQPDYHERKAKNQAKLRKTKKEMRAKGIPC
jgi:hypothetical protein